MEIKKDTISSKIFVRFMVNLNRLNCDNHKLRYNEVLINLIIIIDISTN